MKNLLKLFIKRLRCKHSNGRLLEVTFDGIAIYECADCGKRIYKGW